jgi:protein subunit release factor A
LKECHEQVEKEIKKSESLLQKYEKNEIIDLLEEERQERTKEMDKFKKELQQELLKFEHNFNSLIEVSCYPPSIAIQTFFFFLQNVLFSLVLTFPFR